VAAKEKSFREVAYSRRSIRDFDSTAVPDELINEIIADALTAASWSNTRPYRIAVATGAVRDRISQALLERADDILKVRSARWTTRMKGFVTALKLLHSDFRIPVVYPEDLRRRQIELAKALYGSLGIAREDTAGRDAEIKRNMEFFGAPVALFFFARKGMGVYSALDTGHLMQNLMLAAKARGLDTCAQGFLAFWSEPIRREFDVPKGYKLICGMSVGFASSSSRNQFAPPGIAVTEIVIGARNQTDK
jgi:nitroreductase